MIWVLLALLVVGLLLGPVLGADSRDGHDWTPHYLFPYPGSGEDVGDYWCEKIGLQLDHTLDHPRRGLALLSLLSRRTARSDAAHARAARKAAARKAGLNGHGELGGNDLVDPAIGIGTSTGLDPE